MREAFEGRTKTSALTGEIRVFSPALTSIDLSGLRQGNGGLMDLYISPDVRVLGYLTWN